MSTVTVIGRDEKSRVIEVSLTTVADVAPPGPEVVAPGGGETFNGGTITEPLVIVSDTDGSLNVHNVANTRKVIFNPTTSGYLQHNTDASSGLYFHSNATGMSFQLHADGELDLFGGNGNSMWLLVQDADTTHHVTIKTDDGVEIYPSGGTPLKVKTAAGASVFEVRADGSVHIKTGTSIQADL